MSTQTQLGQGQLGQIQFNGTYTLDDIIDSPQSAGRLRCEIGWGQFGRRRYHYPEVWGERIINEDDLLFPEISFTSISGTLIGKLRTDVQHCKLMELDFTLDKNGCSNFKFKLNSEPDFEILPFSIMQIKIGNTDFYWYGGEVEYAPKKGKQKEFYEYRGFGLNRYLKGLKSESTVFDYGPGMDIGEVVDDIVQSKISPETPIQYNAAKIEKITGVILANTIQLGKYDLWKVMDTLADMANYNWGIDGDLDFYFEPRVNTTGKTFFIGYNINKFDPELNYKEIKNTIMVQRQEGRGAGGAGWAVAGLYNDESSIAKYGRKELNYQIPGYFDDDEAEIIGDALLEEKKDPRESGKLKGYQIKNGLDYLERGEYRFILPFDEYREPINDLDDDTEFSKVGIGDLAIAKDEEIFMFADGSVKLTYTNALNDRAELPLIYEGNIQEINFFIRADKFGSYMTVGVGKTNWDENTITIDMPVIDKFYHFKWDVSELDITDIEVFAIRIDENAATENNVYIDKLDFSVKGHQYYHLELGKANYKFSSTDQMVSADFGILPPKMENYISSLFSTASELRFTGEVR